MKISEKDYLIVVTNKNKKFFVQVDKITEDNISVVIDNADRANSATREAFDIEKRDVICNLGSNPFPGTYCGIKVEPFVKTKQIRPWKYVHIFRQLNSTEEKNILDALKQVGASTQQRGLIPPKPIVVEIRPPKGKYNGYFVTKRKDDDDDILCICAKDLSDSELPHIIWHELGHAIYNRLVSDEFRMRWIAQFIKNTALQEITREDLKRLLQSLKDHGSCKAFIHDNAEEAEVDIVKEIFKYMATRHKLDKRSINLLLATENYDQLDVVWPAKPTLIRKQNIVVSDYASKNHNELFCEAFSFYKVNKIIPENIKKLLVATLKSLGNTGEDSDGPVVSDDDAATVIVKSSSKKLSKNKKKKNKK